MKKSFFLLPLAGLVLNACSSSTPAPVENADGTLTPGIMQPIESTGATGGTWEPEIQQQSMPASMQVPVNQPSTTPSYTQPVQQPAQTSVQQQNSAQVSQDFTIPRNAQTNAPDYSKIDKGFYKGETYQVRKGDTMFLIAYISGLDVKELAALNNMSEPYQLSIGQVLKVSNGSNNRVQPVNQTTATTTQVVNEPTVTYTPAANGTQYGSDGTIIGPVKATTSTNAPAKSTGISTPNPTPITTPTTTTTITNTAPTVTPTSNIAWRWPANGKIIQGFSSADGGNKGIDISGSRGQAVNAAAAGTVVYAGNALRGYGNLIIIKHNDDYLSAYAHNESILVKEQQTVSAGQQIAKMGSSGTNEVKLHFEIRYRGKSVDPLRYLPKR
ncbi:lipoprotein NlpD [Volucribacter psittacicida]|uniref:Lipoprotein NlpD n=1 Tax=Volucribacter psittacicida TaxID=203482 RepID=A0A4R1G4Z1_9PAST|nr:murein hydrolase activator NlpD [Volucribacter psittacicida]TCJ98761.1 lipoprotein NlpD [Volucribacter psittacicida]